jgi:hypothetical protein
MTGSDQMEIQKKGRKAGQFRIISMKNNEKTQIAHLNLS